MFKNTQRSIPVLLSFIYVFQVILMPAASVFAGEHERLQLPFPNALIEASPGFRPMVLKGLTVRPDNPLEFDFILDMGDMVYAGDPLREEGLKLVKYFLATITIPENELWVNLSPYENDRIIPNGFGQTVMGRDLLAQDYVLKQFTASMMYPEAHLGEAFWQRVYKKAMEKYGTTEIPMNTFNKIWIVPDEAVVYENETTAYVVKTHLKVMLEEDYFALQKNLGKDKFGLNKIKNKVAEVVSGVTSEVVRDVLIPEIEKEVNKGKNFALLRQIYHSVILATWYKDNLRDTILNQVYRNKEKTRGVDVDDLSYKEAIYQKYVKSFREGVYNFIKEEYDPMEQGVVARKYFSGGNDLRQTSAVRQDVQTLDRDLAMLVNEEQNNGLAMTVRLLEFTQPNSDKVTEMEAAQQSLQTEAAMFDQNLLQEKFPNRFVTRPNIDIVDPKLSGYVESLRTAREKGYKVLTDVSLEAIIYKLKGYAQLAQGKGGLGFLTGETWNNLSVLKDFNHWLSSGVMPLYSAFTEGDQWIDIDWMKEKGIDPFLIRDASGKSEILTIDVDFNGATYKVGVFWVDLGGTPVFALANPQIFSHIYPEDYSLRMQQYGFTGRAVVELYKQLGIESTAVRMSEPQLFFVGQSMINDRTYFENTTDNEKSVFAETEYVFTTHTPEKAALPIWSDIAYLRSQVGSDLVPDNIIKNGIISAADALGQIANTINGVSPEHGKITQLVVLPQHAWKTTGIQNGSDPYLWYSDALAQLITREGVENVQGRDLFLINEAQKEALNVMLKEKGLNGFDNLDRPLFGALRRLVQYKEQGIYIPIMEWITGERDQTYDTPWGKRLGLGANILLGGVGRDQSGMDWERQLKQMQNDPRFKGKFIFINETGTEVMQKAVSGSNIWLETPRHTREASGTSGGRAGLNGVLVIGTATGEILSFIRNGENGWSVNPFEGWDLGTLAWGFELGSDDIVRRFNSQGVPMIMASMQEASELYYSYRAGTSTEFAQRQESILISAHQSVDIKEMVKHYGIFFDETLRGTGAAGYEVERDKFEKGEGKYGGIDLNPALFQLKIRRDGKGVPLPKQKQPVQSIDIDGFIPVIINVVPLPNLPQSIGILGEAIIEQPVADDRVQTAPVIVPQISSQRLRLEINGVL
ncbi:MAG: hypothetical protein K8S27_14575 [Candidatus Omnitrophica bacterium]|nr:hypothetical protein [Candidatus Omnitrophota bacterium]